MIVALLRDRLLHVGIRGVFRVAFHLDVRADTLDGLLAHDVVELFSWSPLGIPGKVEVAEVLRRS